MKVNEFRFLESNEALCDRQFVNWSRCYEWAYALNEINKLNTKAITVHNTSCGPGEIHKQFSVALDNIGAITYNSDMVATSISNTLSNFFIYDLTKKNDNEYDVVLCISTLEHMPEEDQKIALQNLYDQTKIGGRLIITVDYPNANLQLLEDFTNTKCIDASNRLNGSNSIYQDNTYTHLNIVLLDITK